MISESLEAIAIKIKQLADRVGRLERLDRPNGGTSYTLPTATASVLGGIKVGSRLSIASGVLSADVQGREILTANRTYYVRTDGNDSNNGLANTAGGAFLTIQKAINTAIGLDLSIYSCFINVADGTYAETCSLKSYLGKGPIYLTGNTATPANVVLNSGMGISASEVSGLWICRGFKTSGNSIGVYASGGNTHIQIGEWNFAGTSAQHIYVNAHAWVELIANYTISAGTNIHMQGSGGGMVQTGVFTCTISGTPAFSIAFAYADVCGIVRCSLTFSGSATGKKYASESLSLIFVNGAGVNYFPGDSAGSVAGGSQYI